MKVERIWASVKDHPLTDPFMIAWMVWPPTP